MSDALRVEIAQLQAEIRDLYERLHKAEHRAAKMTGRWEYANAAWREDWLPRLKEQAALLAEVRPYVQTVSPPCERPCEHTRCDLLARIDLALAIAVDDRHLPPENNP